MEEYGINPNTWYSPNDIVHQKLLFGKSKRYLFNMIRSNQLKAINTSETQKPQWKILGKDLIEFINKLERGQESENNNTADAGVQRTA